jgi:hypothetical protein
MRTALRLALAAAAVALLPLGAFAQGSSIFARPFQYSDANGTGTLTVSLTNQSSTRLTFQPIQVTLVQGGNLWVGSGVYHAFSDDTANLPANALLAFTAVDRSGSTRFFQATLTPGAGLPTAPTVGLPTIPQGSGYSGIGTHHAPTAPQAAVAWRIQSSSVPSPGAIVNSAPLLTNGWYRNSLAEAMGGLYYSTFNTFQSLVSTATWTGSVPAPGSYQLEVFIPRQPSPGAAPRTGRAAYQIFPQPGTGGAGGGGASVRVVNQQVSTSQWVPLGVFNFQGSYRVVLTDSTGEAHATRSVVANAIRLTPVR